MAAGVFMQEDPKVAKADEEVQKLISRKRTKDADDRKVSSEIFDKATLQVLYKLANQGHLDVLKMQYYIAGDPRFNVRSSNKRQLINNWVNKEFRNLTRLSEAGVNVPEAITSLNNVLIIEFIGDEEGNPAPTVKNLPPQDPNDFYEQLVEQMDRFINKANLIHGDLSSYNILNMDEKPVIIDVSQSVVRDHIIANELLERDIKNISFEFSKMGVDTSIEDLTNRLLKS